MYKTKNLDAPLVAALTLSFFATLALLAIGFNLTKLTPKIFNLFLWFAIISITAVFLCVTYISLFFKKGYLVFEIVDLKDNIEFELKFAHSIIKGAECKKERYSQKGDFYYHYIFHENGRMFHGTLRSNYEIKMGDNKYFRKKPNAEVVPIEQLSDVCGKFEFGSGIYTYG